MSTVTDNIVAQEDQAIQKIKEMISYLSQFAGTDIEKRLNKMMSNMDNDKIAQILMPSTYIQDMREFCCQNNIPHYIQPGAHGSNAILVCPIDQAELLHEHLHALAVNNIHYYKDVTADEFLNNQKALGRDELITKNFPTQQSLQNFMNKSYHDGYGYVTSFYQEPDGSYTALVDIDQIHQISPTKRDYLDTVIEMGMENIDDVAGHMRNAQINWDASQIDKFMNAMESNKRCVITDGLTPHGATLEFDGRELLFQTTSGAEKQSLLSADEISLFQHKEISREQMSMLIAHKTEQIHNMQFMDQETFKNFKTLDPHVLEQKKELMVMRTMMLCARNIPDRISEMAEELQIPGSIQTPVGARPMFGHELFKYIKEHPDIIAKSNLTSVPEALKTSQQMFALREQVIKTLEQELCQKLPDLDIYGAHTGQEIWNEAKTLLQNPDSAVGQLLQDQPNGSKIAHGIIDFMDETQIRPLQQVRVDMERAQSILKDRELTTDYTFDRNQVRDLAQ